MNGKHIRQEQTEVVTCRQVSSNFLAYLEQTLPANRQQAISEHLATCDACALEWQEVKVIHAELLAEATVAAARQPSLSPEASLRIQEEVYRHMRRSVFIQRTLGLAQMAGAVALAAIFFAGVLLFTSQWLHYLTTPAAIPGESLDIRPEATDRTGPQPRRAFEPMTKEAESNQARPQRTPLPPRLDSQPTSYQHTLTSITPGQQPAEVARSVMQAALSGDSERLQALFVGMRAAQLPTLRVWERVVSRCEVSIAPEIYYQALPRYATLTARVDMYQNGRYIGELKMRHINGEWFTVFATYPAVQGCNRQTK